MFDLFGVDPAKVDEANQQHAINFLALAILLVEKGVITDAEFVEARLRATHCVEQEWAAKRDEARREFAEEYPNLAKFLGDKL
jgi:hypothetical protein